VFAKPAEEEFSKAMKSYQTRNKKWEKDHCAAYRAAADAANASKSAQQQPGGSGVASRAYILTSKLTFRTHSHS
jgi:hypothetical protein